MSCGCVDCHVTCPCDGMSCMAGEEAHRVYAGTDHAAVRCQLVSVLHSSALFRH